MLSLAKNGFKVDLSKLSKNDQLMCLMLNYDIWQNAGGFNSLEGSIIAIGNNTVLTNGIIEFLEIQIDEIDYVESDIKLPYCQPLKLHSRYSREQILVAFGFSKFKKILSNREGVAENKELNTEILFIDLIKSEKDFSPSTLYQDYAISDTLFHWQSQNSTTSDKGKGLTYINQQVSGKIILLFVREHNKNEHNNTMSYVFIGSANITEYYGSKPMNIKWKLEEPMPPYLLKVAARMAVG